MDSVQTKCHDAPSRAFIRSIDQKIVDTPRAETRRTRDCAPAHSPPRETATPVGAHGVVLRATGRTCPVAETRKTVRSAWSLSNVKNGDTSWCTLVLHGEKA